MLQILRELRLAEVLVREENTSLRRNQNG